MRRLFDSASLPDGLAPRLAGVLTSGEQLLIGLEETYSWFDGNRPPHIRAVTTQRLLDMVFYGGYAKQRATVQSTPLLSILKVDQLETWVWINPAGSDRFGINTGSREAAGEFCRVLNAAMTALFKPQVGEDSVEARLERLERLHQNKVVTDQEYQQKRAELIKLL